MPSYYADDSGDDQEWAPIIIRKTAPRFDPAFVELVRARRLVMRLDHAAFGALVQATAATMRTFEDGRLELDMALQHRLRGLLLKPAP